MISAKKEKMLFSSLEKGGRYGTRKPGTHHLRLPYGGSRLPRPVCLQGLQVILLHLPGAGILMSILRELFRKFPFFCPFFVGQDSAAAGRRDIFLLPSSRVPATARLCKTHCTACGTCTTGIAFNGGSESRLLMPVGRASDVARGPRALEERLPVFLCGPDLGIPDKTSGNPFL